MIQNESGRKTDDGGARTSTRRWNRSMMLGMAGMALSAAGISAAATWALRKAATAPEQSIEFVSESEVRIKAVPQGFTEVNQWFSERGLVYGLSLDTTLQIDGLMLSIIPAEGVTLPEGEVMLGGLVFNDAGQVVEFTAPSTGACVIIMTEDSTPPDGRRVRGLGPCDDGTTCLLAREHERRDKGSPAIATAVDESLEVAPPTPPAAWAQRCGGVGLLDREQRRRVTIAPCPKRKSSTTPAHSCAQTSLAPSGSMVNSCRSNSSSPPMAR